MTSLQMLIFAAILLTLTVYVAKNEFQGINPVIGFLTSTKFNVVVLLKN